MPESRTVQLTISIGLDGRAHVVVDGLSDALSLLLGTAAVRDSLHRVPPGVQVSDGEGPNG